MERYVNLNRETSVDFIAQVVDKMGYQIVEQVRLPARGPVFLPPPSRLHPAVLDRLGKDHPGGLYKHQVLSIDTVLDGKDVCVAAPPSVVRA